LARLSVGKRRFRRFLKARQRIFSTASGAVDPPLLIRPVRRLLTGRIRFPLSLGLRASARRKRGFSTTFTTFLGENSMLVKLLVGSVFGLGLLFPALATVKNTTAQEPADCCMANLACCKANLPCCQAGAKSCCTQGEKCSGMACCAKDAKCCGDACSCPICPLCEACCGQSGSSQSGQECAIDCECCCTGS
jgi:hypothetical protein